MRVRDLSRIDGTIRADERFAIRRSRGSLRSLWSRRRSRQTRRRSRRTRAPNGHTAPARRATRGRLRGDGCWYSFAGPVRAKQPRDRLGAWWGVPAGAGNGGGVSRRGGSSHQGWAGRTKRLMRIPAFNITPRVLCSVERWDFYTDGIIPEAASTVSSFLKCPLRNNFPNGLPLLV